MQPTYRGRAVGAAHGGSAAETKPGGPFSILGRGGGPPRGGSAAEPRLGGLCQLVRIVRLLMRSFSACALRHSEVQHIQNMNRDRDNLRPIRR
jgi:hypothetical protein